MMYSNKIDKQEINIKISTLINIWVNTTRNALTVIKLEQPHPNIQY